MTDSAELAADPAAKALGRPGFALLLIALAALTYRLWTFGAPSLSGYDEQIYGHYARVLGEQGMAGIRAVIREWPADEGLRQGPLPFRIFYILLGALACKLCGSYDLGQLALLSLGCGLGTVLFGYLLCRRWFRPGTAFLAGLLFITSPLATALSRRALQDSLFALLILAAILLYDQCWRRPSPWRLALLTLVLLAGFLTKETLCLLYPSFAVAALVYGFSCGWRGRAPLLVPFALAPLLYALALLWLAGDGPTLCRTYAAYVQAQGQIDYAARYQRGPWFRYMVDFLLLSPPAALLCMAGIARPPAASESRDGWRLALAYLATGLLVFSALPLLNVRLVLFLDVPLRALAAYGIVSLLGLAASPSPRRLLAWALPGAVLLLDWRQFTALFVDGNIYDPITAALVRVLGFMPR